MPWIKGIPVTLYEKTQTDEDAFHDPVYTEIPVTVENVLVTPADAAAVADEVQLNGHHLAYELCIPKGDAHSWDDVTVSSSARNGTPMAVCSSTSKSLCRWTGTKR